MSLTKRLFVASLVVLTIALNTGESFAGPLQAAVPPGWLTQASPRQTHPGMSCGKKVLLGLGIGAGAGAAWGLIGISRGVGERGAIMVSLPTLFGGVGALVGYRLCP